MVSQHSQLLQVYKKDVPLDEAGFQQVLKSYDSGSMETFLRSGSQRGERRFFCAGMVYGNTWKYATFNNYNLVSGLV